jgi:hypothetical protein
MAPTTTQLAPTPEITMVDRTTTQLQPATHHEQQEEEEALNTAPPPPYTDVDADDSFNESDSDSDSDPRDIYERPQKITINAGRTITGVGNLVSPASLSSLAEAKLFSTTLLTVVSQLNHAAGRRRRLNVDLTINCGITIVGHKNVVGVPMRRNAEGKFTPSSGLEAMAVRGAKRKAEDEVSVSCSFDS